MANLLKERYDALVATWVALPEERRAVLLDDFGVRYAYNSGKIKNRAVDWRTVSSVFSTGAVEGYSGDVRTLFDIWDLRVSWEWARGLATPDLRFSEELVQEAHELLTMGAYDVGLRMRGERPGAFKLENYVSGPADVGDPAASVPHAVGELVDDVNSFLDEGRRSLTIATYLHARLTEIHPFADGNGRVARLLMNMALLVMGMPPIVVREQDRASYYGGLDIFHLEGDLSPFRRFLRNEALLTWGGLID